MKKLISTFIVTVIMFTSMSVPALAYNYQFSSGYDYSDTLGKPTSTDALADDDPMTENTRRNKDASYNPPPYGTGSGDIPTEYSSLYHNNSTPYNGGTVGVTYTPINTGGSVSPDTGTDYGGMLPPTLMYSPDILNVQPLYYDDGSIGTLSIPKLNITVKVYEGETLDNMKNGIGHF